MRDKSKITQFGNLYYKNPDTYALAQSSVSPEDFSSRRGAGCQMLTVQSRPGIACLECQSQLKWYRAAMNEGGVMNVADLTAVLEEAIHEDETPVELPR